MGVPRLFPWLTRAFERAVKHFQQGEYSQNVSYMYLDANGLLHGAAQEVFHYGPGKKMFDRYKHLSEEAKRKKVYSLFFDNILQVTQIIRPQKVLYIAIDGPAPLAKQAQQRQRRFAAAIARGSVDEKTGRIPFDSSSITPGTIFMLELTRYINYAIRKEMNSYHDLKNVDVIFSPPTVAGEGEHKIMDYIRDLPESEKMRESHCLFGPDGDLIMLTLSSHIPDMWLFREDQYSPGFYHLLNMGYVRKNLPEKLRQNSGVRTYNNVTDDFIIEGFFVGNDFLPKIQMFHLLEDGLQFMFSTYENTSVRGKKNFLTVNGRLSLPGFRNFVLEISKSEEIFLIDQVTTQNRKKTPPEPKFRNETLLSCITTKKVHGRPVHSLNFKEYRMKYYSEKMHFSQEELDEKIQSLCRDYIRSFIWVFDYYVHGLPAWRWAYEHHYAPLMCDLSEFVQNLTDKEFQELSTFNLQSPSLPFEQLLSVLPPLSAGLLPRTYQRLILDSRSPLVEAGYYPDEFPIDYEGKLQEYQGVALLPFVDYNVIHRNYERMTKCCVKNSQKYIRNSVGRVALFRYDPHYSANFSSDMGNISRLHIRKTLL